MNLVGKILTVFILVMSIFFCALAVAVYATHKNWYDIVMRPREAAAAGKQPGLKFQLEDEQERYDRLKAEKDDLEARLTAERNLAVNALKKLENELVLKNQDLDQLRRDNSVIDQERREALSRLATSEVRLAALRTQVEGNDQDVLGLRNEILKAQKEREHYFNEWVRLTDERNDLSGKLQRLKDYQRTMRQDLDKALAVLRKHDLKPEPDLYRDAAPPVDGLVESTLDGKLIQITLGSDDGLLPKHKLEVYRNARWVGRIEVVSTNPDKAVCQIVPGYQEGHVQRNDVVTSRLLR